MNILKKLTLKNLRKNKTRTIVTIAGIALSIALVTIIAGVAASGRASSRKAVETLTGDYTFAIGGDFDNTQIEKVRSNRSVRDVYYYGFIGTSPFEDSNSKYRPYLLTMSIDSKTLNDNSIRLKEGRYAEKDDEIVLSADYVNYSSKTYKVGDKLTLKTGERYFSESGKKELQVTPEYADEPLQYFFPYLFENEEFRQTGTKTYTIVGITGTEGGFLDNNNNLGTGTNVRLYTYSPDCKTEALYIRLKDECEADYLNIAAQMTGVNADLIKDYLKGTISEKGLEKLTDQAEKGDLKVFGFYHNSSLLGEKGIDISGGSSSLTGTYLIAGFVILIVIIASVFIIRNSFAISLTEKTKLYGMLSSTGATPRQIRNCVFFEALILGLIGIPLGIGIGAGGTWLLISLVGTILKDQLGSMDIVFDMTWMTVITAAVLGVLTIFLSSLSSAVRAQRIPPIEAIRSSNDIKVGKENSERSYKTPGFIKKLFGAGGSIAWKNMKRSRKQYRTTVISIIVSVSVFLTVYSFVDYGIKAIESEDYYKKSTYNMSLQLGTADDKNKSYPLKELEQKYSQIGNSEGINKYKFYVDSITYETVFDKKYITDEFNEFMKKYSDDQSYDSPDGTPTRIAFIAMDENEFRHICDETGNDFEKCRDKGFISSSASMYFTGMKNRKNVKMLKDSFKGKTLKASTEIYIYPEDANDEKPEYDEEYYEEPETEIVSASVEIADMLPEDYDVDPFSSGMYLYVVTTFDTFSKLDRIDEIMLSGTMFVDAEEPDELEERANDGKLSSEIGIYGVTNYSKMINNMRSLILVVEIFVYGFIAVITLIGVTNIFNTITTNMKLRRKEFAMLQSIGTTHKEFNRMIRLESLLYTFKSLIIGIPIGIAGSTAVYWLFLHNSGYTMAYSFPLMAVLISILAVLIILWMIMRFSISKLKKQNIIETIRNDNI